MLALFVAVFALSSAAVAQSSHPASEMPYSGAPCTASGGIPPSARQVADFKRFDTELRSALERNDIAALAFLIDFPLRVNTGKGSLLIPDSKSLSGHYAEIFPPQVRDQVLTTMQDDYICRYDEGLAYKNGVIWASTDGHKFTLSSVNEPNPNTSVAKPALIYTCETKSHRIAIEELDKEGLRYRSWNKPKPLSVEPDVNLVHGKQEFQGTGVCSYPLYTFAAGNVVYEVQGSMGCGDGSEPAKATGHLSVTVGGKQVTDDWCF
jgi:hypothetical protein